MPIYEYECKKCGFLFEFLTIKENKVKCPKCDSYKITRIISKSNFVLKGSGWSKDNYSKSIEKGESK